MSRELVAILPKYITGSQRLISLSFMEGTYFLILVIHSIHLSKICVADALRLRTANIKKSRSTTCDAFLVAIIRTISCSVFATANSA